MMRKALSTIVAALVSLSFTGIARAVPATDTMDQSISVLENEKGGSTVPVKKPPKKAKKAHKQNKAAKKPAGAAQHPAPSEAPAGPASTASPATTPVSK
jgi:hypothetical protein